VFRVTSTNLDFPSIAGNGRATIDVTVASAEVGDAVLAVPTTARTGNFQQIIFSGFVSSANTVTVLAVNTYSTALDLPSLAFKILVFKGI
jgi:acyl-coenzyme A thioesterase PaaI-like protein